MGVSNNLHNSSGILRFYKLIKFLTFEEVRGGRNMIDGRYSEKKNKDKKKHLNSFNDSKGAIPLK
jgi:hypothetical protein